MEKIKLHVFHHNDADGRLSAAIVWRKYELRFEVVFHEMGYETKPDFSMIRPDDFVYVVDFSFKDDDFARLRAAAKEVTWIDHHRVVKDSKHQDLPGLRHFQDKGMAACELTWKYLFNDKAPRVVSLVGDYDSWAMKLAPSCVEFYEAAKADDLLQKPMGWVRFLDADDADLDRMIGYGAAMVRYRDGYCANLRKLYGYRASLFDDRWYVEGGGLSRSSSPRGVAVNRTSPVDVVDGVDPKTHTWAYEIFSCAYALNVQCFGSLAFGDALLKEYPLVIAYIHNGKEFVVSLYSVKSDIDCSVIAKAFGGGGHKGAAGFRCTLLPWGGPRYGLQVVDPSFDNLPVT